MVVDQVVEYLGLFDGIIVLYSGYNLKGDVKFDVICDDVGGEFEYLGNDMFDLVIWKDVVQVGVVNVLSFV